jgi:AraC family transcriptional regulator
MNIYKCLNEITLFIDENLEEEISYEKLAKIMGVNSITMQKIFSLLVGFSLGEYIRNRRLSAAGYDLYNKSKVIDVAIKYQYDSPTSFSRAFEKFHGIKPSEVSKNTKLNNFSRIVFDETINSTSIINYEIVDLDEFNLYGVYTDTSNKTIMNDAPRLFEETENKYINLYGPIKYGMITYDIDRSESQRYYCLYDKKVSNFEHIYIPKCKWLKFRIDSQDACMIQDMSHKFYLDFLPSCKYNLKDLPELEYYHDGVTDFLVPIY